MEKDVIEAIKENEEKNQRIEKSKHFYADY